MNCTNILDTLVLYSNFFSALYITRVQKTNANLDEYTGLEFRGQLI